MTLASSPQKKVMMGVMIFAAIPITLLLLCISVTILVDHIPRQYDLSDSFEATLGFFYSMMQNNLELANLIVVQEQHPLLDNWMTSHRPASCPLLWSFTNNDILEGIESGGGTCVTDGDSCHTSYYIICDRFDLASYYFSIDDIELRKVDDQWMVVKWGLVCEGEYPLVARCSYPSPLK
jgi:hypothetical protein